MQKRSEAVRDHSIFVGKAFATGQFSGSGPLGLLVGHSALASVPDRLVEARDRAKANGMVRFGREKMRWCGGRNRTRYSFEPTGQRKPMASRAHHGLTPCQIVFEHAAALQIRGDARGTEGMIAHRCVEPGKRSKGSRRQCICGGEEAARAVEKLRV